MVSKLGKINHFLIWPVYYLIRGFFFFFGHNSKSACCSHSSRLDSLSFLTFGESGIQGKRQGRRRMMFSSLLGKMTNLSPPCGKPIPDSFLKVSLEIWAASLQMRPTKGCKLLPTEWGCVNKVQGSGIYKLDSLDTREKERQVTSPIKSRYCGNTAGTQTKL